MELHSPAAAKRLWKLLRVAFLMMRKGLISKRKLLMDMNLMMKRGRIMGKSIIGNIVFHHQRPSRGYGFSLQDYEFSCSPSPSPSPVFFPAKRRHHHYYFPCLSSLVEGDHTPAAAAFRTVQEMSASPLSNFSSDDAEPDGVDNAAEDFIRRFYEQLRVQSRIALIEYQEMEYQED